VTIEVQLNGEVRETEQGVSLDALIDKFQLPKQRVAVELNRSVIRRIDWPTTPIKAGDVIEVIHFVGGG